jgi:hypothetical protein
MHRDMEPLRRAIRRLQERLAGKPKQLEKALVKLLAIEQRLIDFQNDLR